MPEHTTIATEYASAVAHPIRLRLVAALGEGPRTLESLGSELDASDADILRHASALEELDLLQATDHPDGARTYELRREPVFWDTAWARLPLAAKRSAAAAGVTQLTAAATAAVDRGGFDRPDMHLTRTSLRVDEARWHALAGQFSGMLHRLGDMAEAPEPDGSSGPTFQATAVMMLFTGEHAETDAHVPSPRWDEEEALRRVWDLTEMLAEITPRAITNWDAIAAIAGELRLIAKSMKEHSDDAPTQRHAH